MRIDAISCDGSGYRSSGDPILTRQRMQRRNNYVVPVDFETPAQSAASVTATKSIGAQRYEMLPLYGVHHFVKHPASPSGVLVFKSSWPISSSPQQNDRQQEQTASLYSALLGNII